MQCGVASDSTGQLSVCADCSRTHGFDLSAIAGKMQPGTVCFAVSRRFGLSVYVVS